MSDTEFMHDPIILNVAYVEYGGNTGRGRYFYSFKPDIVSLFKGQSPCHLKYELDPALGKRFKIISALLNDPLAQMYGVRIDPKDAQYVEMVNSNTRQSLVFLSLVVEDTHANPPVRFNCDPQVGSDPEVSPL